jgi:hypothetical protein
MDNIAGRFLLLFCLLGASAAQVFLADGSIAPPPVSETTMHILGQQVSIRQAVGATDQAYYSYEHQPLMRPVTCDSGHTKVFCCTMNLLDDKHECTVKVVISTKRVREIGHDAIVNAYQVLNKDVLLITLNAVNPKTAVMAKDIDRINIGSYGQLKLWGANLDCTASIPIQQGNAHT